MSPWKEIWRLYHKVNEYGHFGRLFAQLSYNILYNFVMYVIYTCAIQIELYKLSNLYKVSYESAIGQNHVMLALIFIEMVLRGLESM